MDESPNTHSFESFINEIDEKYKNSMFDGIVDVFENNKNIIQFYLSRNEDVTKPFIGSDEDLIEFGGHPIDREKLFESIVQSEEINFIESVKLGKDIAEFYHSKIPEGAKFEEVIRELYELDDFDVSFEEFSERTKEKLDVYRQALISELKQFIRSFKQKKGFAGLYSLSNEEIKSSVREFEEELDELDNMTYTQLLRHSIKSDIESYESVLDDLKFTQIDPDKGDYLVYSTNIQKKLYNVIVRVTGYTTTENSNDIEVPAIEYDVIAYDNDLLDSWPNHWVINETEIVPETQSSFEVHSENPLGDIEMKVDLEEVVEDTTLSEEDPVYKFFTSGPRYS